MHPARLRVGSLEELEIETQIHVISEGVLGWGERGGRGRDSR